MSPSCDLQLDCVGTRRLARLQRSNREIPDHSNLPRDQPGASFLKAESEASGYTHRTRPRCRHQSCAVKMRLVFADYCMRRPVQDLLLSRLEFANMVTGFI